MYCLYHPNRTYEALPNHQRHSLRAVVRLPRARVPLDSAEAAPGRHGQLPNLASQRDVLRATICGQAGRLSQFKIPSIEKEFVSRRINLPQILRLSLSEEDGENPKWSAFTIAEAWAVKRGYVTARSNRPDLNRSANHLLRMTLEGKIPLHTKPMDYYASGSRWEGHEDTDRLRRHGFLN